MVLIQNNESKPKTTNVSKDDNNQLNIISNNLAIIDFLILTKFFSLDISKSKNGYLY